MRNYKQYYKSITLSALLFSGFSAGALAQDTTNVVDPETRAPVIVATTPGAGAMNVDPGSVIEITFSSEMDESTINGNTLMLHITSVDSIDKADGHNMDHQIKDEAAIKDTEDSWEYSTRSSKGTISYSDKVATFTPDSDLKEGTVYTFTITKDVKSSENVALENDHSWSFTTMGDSDTPYADKQDDRNGMDRDAYSDKTVDASNKDEKKMINLGKAGQFVILAKTDIKKESESKITGHVGEGSVDSEMKKEKDVADREQQRVSGQVAVLQSDQSDTTSPDVSEAIEDMMNAYSDASTNNGDEVTNHETERFYHSDGLSPGVHEWNATLHIDTDVTLSGSEDDVWLFRVNEDLIMDENLTITLSDGAQPDNIFWYVEGEVTIGKDAQFEGIILSMNEITLEKGAKLNGRMFSQASITLDDNTITEPTKMDERTTSTSRRD